MKWQVGMKWTIGDEAKEEQIEVYLGLLAAIEKRLLGEHDIPFLEYLEIPDFGSLVEGDLYTKGRRLSRYEDYLGFLDGCGYEQAETLLYEFQRARSIASAARREHLDEEYSTRIERLAAIPPTPLTREELQKATERAFFEYMKNTISMTPAAKLVRYGDDGRVYYFSASFKYIIRSFDGCEVRERLASCKADISIDLDGNIPGGTGNIQGVLAELLRGQLSARIEDFNPDLKFVLGEWVIQVPTMLFR